jgi:hypothetical protein
MSNQRYFPGPYWTMNSSEAGASFIMLCIILTIQIHLQEEQGWLK